MWPQKPQKLGRSCWTLRYLAVYFLALLSLNVRVEFSHFCIGTLGAEAGTLTFMVGSPSLAQFESIRDSVLVHMGKNIVHCGQVGNGQVAKICNNMMLGISMIAASETMNLGVRLGE